MAGAVPGSMGYKVQSAGQCAKEYEAEEVISYFYCYLRQIITYLIRRQNEKAEITNANFA